MPMERVRLLIEPSMADMGYRLVRVRYTGGGRPVLQIMAERVADGGMDIEDCEAVSRAVSALLDVEDPIPGNYTLEVSSPGIDRPLTRPKDYVRWAGHIARLETALPVEGRRRFKGTLLGLEDNLVRLRLDDGKEAAVPLEAVTRAKLELTDRLIEEHRLAAEGAAGQTH